MADNTAPISGETLTEIAKLNAAIGAARTPEAVEQACAAFEALWWKARKTVKARLVQALRSKAA